MKLRRRFWFYILFFVQSFVCFFGIDFHTYHTNYNNCNVNYNEYRHNRQHDFKKVITVADNCAGAKGNAQTADAMQNFA